MAKPMSSVGALPVELEATAVFMPMTCPWLSTSGPPEFPGLMAASVWSSPVRFSVWPLSFWAVSERPSADTIPSVTVGPPARASAFPMARTESPTRACDESPRFTVGRPEAWSIWTSARSWAGSVPSTREGRALVCPNRVTVTVVAPATTWLLVSTSPVEREDHAASGRLDDVARRRAAVRRRRR